MKKRKVRKRKSKKKSYKKLWITLGIVGLVTLLTASGLVYYFFLREYEVADSKVTDIVREAYTIDLPDGTIIKFDEEGQVIETIPGDGESTLITSSEQTEEQQESGVLSDTDASTGQVGPTSATTEENLQNEETSEGTTSSPTVNPETTPNGNSSSGGNVSSGGGTAAGGTTTSPSTPPTDNAVGSQKPTVADIKRKYEPTFAALESQANAKLNALLSNAKAEFDQKRANGEDISYGYFYNKYTPAANRLETNTNTVFNSVLAVVQEDLKKNGYAEGYADSFRSDYEERKAARRASILNQVR